MICSTRWFATLAPAACAAAIVVLGWCCAVKMLNHRFCGAHQTESFEREMAILYRMPPHRNIIRCMSWCDTHLLSLSLCVELYQIADSLYV
jgi:hypothetical protein